MTTTRRSLIVRDLIKASAALQEAYFQAKQLEDFDLAQQLKDQGVAVAALVSAAQRTPEQRRALEQETSS